MRSYLVDFENVKSKGLVGIDKLTEDDHVIIFYSENSDTISFEMHCCVMRAKASVEYMKVRVGGKNALDFQLSTLLGYMVAKEKNSHIFIISNDKGFDRLHDFWANTFDDAPDCMVFRTQNIMSAINFAKKNVPVPIYDESESVSEQPSDEGQDERTEGITAEIVVTTSENAEDNSESDDTAVDDEPKFIVPEQLIEQFRSEQRSERAVNSSGSSISQEDLHSYEVSDVSKVSDLSEMSEKCELVRGYMQGITDERVISAVADAVAAADSKLELHNMLMKQFDNEHSSMYYNYMKPHYEYLKRTMSEIEANILHEERKDEEDIKSVKTVNSEAYHSSEPSVQPELTVSDNTEEDSASPKKVDAAMKKTLHRLLDDIVTPDEFSGVVAQINQSSTCRQLYINLMQRFKKQRGRELYGVIKNEFRAFCGNKPKMKSAASHADSKKIKDDKAARAVSAPLGEEFTEKLKASFEGRLADGEFAIVCELAGACASTHELYLAVIKRFKKQKGLFIYNNMKKDFGDYLKSQNSVSV